MLPFSLFLMVSSPCLYIYIYTQVLNGYIKKHRNNLYFAFSVNNIMIIYYLTSAIHSWKYFLICRYTIKVLNIFRVCTVVKQLCQNLLGVCLFKLEAILCYHKQCGNKLTYEFSLLNYFLMIHS